MRLKKIKLSGFKSFVDPTAIQLYSNLTGVVGPNGCGKSNIIDAVRWVMGEISAKQLRGESMTDVIFNGSAARKPTGQAAVELTFDNSDASLGGEYAQYSEIAIRREVDRDSASDYFLNGTRCRRKDITDVFLGTGLGPRSYAIIEQGMISQLIEAKPDELRIYIEEAAGISKYKERRKETENRIKHTKDNLNRLNDIREELEKQLKHLKSQANAANRYKKLKQEERLTKAQIFALNWKEISEKLSQIEIKIQNDAALFEDKIGAIHSLEAKTAQSREELHSSSENLNRVQEQFYKIGATISRLEQEIQTIKNRKLQLTKDLAEINQTLVETTQHQKNDHEQIEVLQTKKRDLEAGIQSAECSSQKSFVELCGYERQMNEWQQKWDEFNQTMSNVVRELQVRQTEIQHLEQKIAQETQIIDNFSKELSSIDFGVLSAELNSTNEKFFLAKAEYDELHNILEAKQQQAIDLREKNNIGAADLDLTRNRLHELHGRKSSLEALQQTALGKTDGIVIDWLKQHNLHENLRLAQKLNVEPGWETAVETVLDRDLEAVCLDDLEIPLRSISDVTQGNLVLYGKGWINNPVKNAARTTLASKVSGDIFLDDSFNNIFIAESFADALAIRESLNINESVITKDGIWLGKSFARTAFDKNQKSGVIQRERELQYLGKEILDLKVVLSEQEFQFNEQKLEISQLEKSSQELQVKLRSLSNSFGDMQGEVSSKETHLKLQQERHITLVQQLKMHEEWLASALKDLDAAKVFSNEAKIKKESNENLQSTLLNEKERLQVLLSTAKETATRERQNCDSIKMQIELAASQIEFLKQNLERAVSRLASLEHKKNNLESSIKDSDTPLIDVEKNIQDELAKRIDIENQLTVAKQHVADIENTIQIFEKNRLQLQEIAEQIRTSLEKLKTEREGFQVRASTYIDSINEMEFVKDSLLNEMPPEANIQEWEQRLTQIIGKIERLGAINLAAIDEFAKLEERKNYLDLQNQDLVTALETLEGAIRKIDQDTKSRFKDTYENINQKFQELFPKVFNGGKAYLELTSGDLLETGVQIMAQPPGKRNASIHLLSGGEKALTAISLIFSIFQLNPAPFCMLDEVDAPLDDLNVIRFCNLVKEMSKTIQFIFVTHNKLTMETAEQLSGVTMQEAGVSRIVTVDINEAIALAH